MNYQDKFRGLEQNATEGDLLPIFQLYQNYVDGKNGVDENKIIAQQYLNQCVQYLSEDKNRFRLKSLELYDFRRFQRLKVMFENDLTVLIGDNGKGKTTILDAIAKTLSWFSANIIKEDGIGQRISELYDIKNDSKQNYSEIVTKFSYGKGLKDITVRLSKAAPGLAEKKDSDIKKLKEIANIWRIINSEVQVDLPLYAFYSIERSYPIKYGKNISELRDERFDAYNDALKGAGKFEYFIEWFIALHKKTVNDYSLRIEELRQQVSDLKKSVEKGIVSLKPLLDDTRHKLAEALLKQKIAGKHQTLTDFERKEVISNAICAVVPSINKIWVETDSGSDIIMIENDGINVRLEQLSDGQRVLLALVSDLTRRLILLNPVRKNPLHGQGIVLIDEIELHLHPRWQQRILLDLQKTFSNIQFIVTTHSPQVLSTVGKHCIRQFIDINNDGEATISRPDFQTKGVINSDVLERVMGVSATPDDIEQSHWLGQFEQLLAENSYERNPKAQAFYEKMKNHFGLDSNELKRCDSLIRVQTMKIKMQQKMKK
ncbi:AAA family ATPase [Arsenophonus sp. aPb]|uniref:retron Ec78 anti-phage system effector ATPase PtuA n=1 Tax=Arsenophonus sp. aPb TaxID=3041619 RepID=UPI00246829F6|nr:retron Ec78 anti-phage system effector ATPase PtuA [Arsenophonus sp. aPb]WGL99519.1 AAA family ATPase [Arsenophonus sp. aPb]